MLCKGTMNLKFRLMQVHKYANWNHDKENGKKADQFVFKRLLLIRYPALPESSASFFLSLVLALWKGKDDSLVDISLRIKQNEQCRVCGSNWFRFPNRIYEVYFSLISAMSVQCSTSWAIRPTESWSLREFVIIRRWTYKTNSIIYESHILSYGVRRKVDI